MTAESKRTKKLLYHLRIYSHQATLGRNSLLLLWALRRAGYCRHHAPHHSADPALKHRNDRSHGLQRSARWHRALHRSESGELIGKLRRTETEGHVYPQISTLKVQSVLA